MDRHDNTDSIRPEAEAIAWAKAATIARSLRLLTVQFGDGSAASDQSWVTIAAALADESTTVTNVNIPVSQSLRSLFSLRMSVAYARSFIGIWRRLDRCDTVLVRLTTASSVFTSLLPVLMATRLHQCRLVVQWELNAGDPSLTMLGKFMRPILNRVDAVVTSSEWEGTALRRHRIISTVIPPVVPVTEGHPIGAIQPRLAVHADAETINDLGLVCRAFAVVKQKYPRTEMCITTSPELYRRVAHAIAIERLQSNSGITIEAGLASDVPSSAGDVYVCLDGVGRFPHDLISAWRRGLPVLVPAATPAASMIRDRENGLTFATNSNTSLADRILELVESPDLVRKVTGQGIREARRFTWSAVRTEWRRLLSPSA
jgi:hypothetical protein